MKPSRSGSISTNGGMISDSTSMMMQVGSSSARGPMLTRPRSQQPPLSDSGQDNPHLQSFSILFTCLYYQQIINIARPMLSLSPTSVQHALALQSSINSVRTICTTLSRTMKHDVDALSWPGYVDMVFFGSLILVYGARKEGNRPGTLKL